MPAPGVDQLGVSLTTLATDLATAAGITLFEAPARLARAVAQPASGAEKELQEVLALARRSEARLVQVGALLALTVAATRRGAREEAVERLREGLRIEGELGVLYVPWLRRGDLTECCALALEHGTEVEHVRALIAAHRLTPGERACDLEAWPRDLSIEALRGFVVRRKGRPVEAGRKAQKKPLQLLQHLVAGGPGGVGQETLAEALWPDAEGDAAHHALKMTVHRLRRFLESTEAIVQREGRVAIDANLVHVDLWFLSRVLDRIEAEQRRATHPSGALHDLRTRLSVHDFDEAPCADDPEPGLRALRDRIRRRAIPWR